MRKIASFGIALLLVISLVATALAASYYCTGTLYKTTSSSGSSYVCISTYYYTGLKDGITLYPRYSYHLESELVDDPSGTHTYYYCGYNTLSTLVTE